MGATQLFYRVSRTLVNEKTPDSTRNLVEAAFESKDAVEYALKTTQELTEKSEVNTERARIPQAFLQKLDVTGFRGIGPQTTVHFPTGPGLTLVIGRNGSEKSSLAEALEVALTGDSFRWSERKSKTDWLAGWKNLHTNKRPTITASFQVDGQKEPVEIKRQWEVNAGPDDAKLLVKQGGKEQADFDAVGWKDAVTTFRPILSYNEIGAALEKGPAQLFDSLDAVLGLEELTTVKTRLADCRKLREHHSKTAKDLKKAALALTETSQDPRAEIAQKLLKARKLNLEELVVIVEGEHEDESRLHALKMAVALKCPTAEDTLEATEMVRKALREADAIKNTQMGMDYEVADLLTRAIELHLKNHESTCPVCGSDALDGAWLDRARQSIEAMRSQKSAVHEAEQTLKIAVRNANQLIARTSPPPACPDLSAGLQAQQAYEDWKKAPEGPELALHLETRFEPLFQAYVALRQQAEEVLQTMETEWRPVKRAISAYLEAAESAQTVDEDIKALKTAEDWVVAFEETVREERFAPIASHAQQIWEELRNQSNIGLKDVKLTGRGNRRKLELGVTVDDEETVALGVMSQGELHSLLLSLFLPRLTLDESPFSFLVLDDPVQAMDPAKVDGLARVLERTSKTHQVIVFTHDTRLADAVRRLRIPAHIKSVTRQDRSVVSVESSKTPAWQLVEDAMNVASNRHEMAPNIAQRVIPGLCRGAFEAAFKEMAWEKLLAAGWSHADCENEIRNATKTMDLARLALLGPGNANDVVPVMDNKFKLNPKHFPHTTVSQVVRTTVNHSHTKPYPGDVLSLIDETKAVLKVMGAT